MSSAGHLNPDSSFGFVRYSSVSSAYTESLCCSHGNCVSVTCVSGSILMSTNREDSEQPCLQPPSRVKPSDRNLLTLTEDWI